MYFTIGQRAPLPNVPPLQRGVYKYHYIFRGKGWNARRERGEGGGLPAVNLHLQKLWISSGNFLPLSP